MRMRTTEVRVAVLLLVNFLYPVLPFANPSSASVPPSRPSVLVCTDKDCALDGAEQMLSIAKRVLPASVDVKGCGCIGPCGKGPNLKILDEEGIRVKDKRPGENSFYCFRRVDSVEALQKVLKTSLDLDIKGNVKLPPPVSSRTFWDIDRTKRIALQRLLYICTFLPMIDRYQKVSRERDSEGQDYPKEEKEQGKNKAINTHTHTHTHTHTCAKGEWDVIFGSELPNSYVALGFFVAVGSQLMGTSAKR